MKQDNRVLSRIGARELTEKEAEVVTGGVRTLTICTVPFNSIARDGDIGEC